MASEDKLKDIVGSDTGFRIPDGYFPSVFSEISSSLPERKPAALITPTSKWQKIKPFVYLAAMFAGIWCMMQLFHNVSSSSSVSLDNPPAAFAQVAGSDDYMGYYTSAGYQDDYELESDVAAQYESIDEFIDDFDYQLQQRYDAIDVSEVDRIIGNSESNS